MGELRAYKDGNGLWRIDRVPIISTGIEYPLATGPTTFTEEQIADAVAAFADPAIKPPRIKLGHSSGYNAALVGDAEQAFGRVENLELGNYGQTVYGDYVGVPEWLASVLPIAYPSRSIEGDFDIATNTGRNYKMVISAVSLLGVRWPGCSVLEDLPLYYGAETPPGVEIDISTEVPGGILANAGGGMKPGERIKAAVDIDLVHRAFYTEVAVGDSYWWWIRADRYDDASGLQLIVDRDDGTLARVPVSVSGSTVSFGDPVEVTEEYPDKIAAASFVAGMATAERNSGADVVIFASRADTTQDRPAVNATQGGTMDDATRRALATRVGLNPETATEDEINAKIDELRQAAPAAQPDLSGQSGTGTPDGGPEGLDPNKTTGTENETVGGASVAGGPVTTPPESKTPEAGAPDVEAGLVKLDPDTYARLKAGAEAGLRLEQQNIAAARTRLLDDAIQAGKFSPARRPHYEKLLASDFEGGKQLIDGLMPGTIPMGERGNAGSQDMEAGAGGGNDGLLGMDANLDRELTQIRAGQVPGRSGRIMQAKEA